MGNNSMKEYKENYINEDYKLIKKYSNNLFGKYNWISMYKPKQNYFYMKIVNPNNYNNYSSDIDYFIERIKREHKNINKFIFLTSNKNKEEDFDIIFEYNPTLYDLLILQKRNIFKTEKEIWLLIEDMLEAFIFMENKKEHLIELNFSTICLKDGKDFCTLNPYLLENYIDDVLGIYWNNNIDKNTYNKRKINKNLIEFGILILNIINRDYHGIRLKNNNFLDQLEKVKNKISKKLYELLIIIFNKENLFVFSDIKDFIMSGSNLLRFKKILEKYSSQISTSNKPKANIFKTNQQKKENYSNKSNSNYSNNSYNNYNLNDLNKNVLNNSKINENKTNSKMVKLNSYEHNIDKKSFYFKTKSYENMNEEEAPLNLIKNNNNNLNKYKPLSLRNIDELKTSNKSYNMKNSDILRSNNNNNNNKINLPFLKNSNITQETKIIVNINLITENNKKKTLYKITDNIDKLKNDHLYKHINKIVNWDSMLKESLYH